MPPIMSGLEHRNVLVTGGSGGIGPYIARALAREGATVALTARSQSQLSEVAVSLKDSRGQPLAISADLRVAEDRERLIETVTRHHGRIDILVNNAGLEFEGAFAAQSPEDIASTIDVNLVAPIALTRRVLPSMLANGLGHIVNIASLGGKRGVPYDAVYCATKAGLIEWSHALRLETADHGVGVSVICPGYVTGAGMFARFGMRPPLSIGSCTPEQVANAVVHAIQRNRGEIIVNTMPLRPLLALGALSPSLMDWLLTRIGIVSFQRRKVTHSDHHSS